MPFACPSVSNRIGSASGEQKWPTSRFSTTVPAACAAPALRAFAVLTRAVASRLWIFTIRPRKSASRRSIAKQQCAGCRQSTPAAAFGAASTHGPASVCFLPGWNLLAWLLLVPGIHWIAAKAYAWIARNRYRWNSPLARTVPAHCTSLGPLPRSLSLLSVRHRESPRCLERHPALLSLSMNPWTPSFLRWFAGPRLRDRRVTCCPAGYSCAAMGVIYFSAFYSLVFQIRGLLGPDGLLPAGMYLNEVAKYFGASRYWYAPTLLWLSSTDRALMALCWIGMIASVLLILNLWPRGHAADLFRSLFVVRHCRAGFLRLPIRSACFSPPDSYAFFSRRADFRPGFGISGPSLARQPLPAATLMVFHLFRFRHCQVFRRRSFLARFHRHGSVLSERSAAHLARLVCAANAALVPRGCRGLYRGRGTSIRVVALSSAPLSASSVSALLPFFNSTSFSPPITPS